MRPPLSEPQLAADSIVLGAALGHRRVAGREDREREPTRATGEGEREVRACVVGVGEDAGRDAGPDSVDRREERELGAAAAVEASGPRRLRAWLLQHEPAAGGERAADLGERAGAIGERGRVRSDGQRVERARRLLELAVEEERHGGVVAGLSAVRSGSGFDRLSPSG